MQKRHGANDKTSYLAALNALKGWTVREWIAGIHIPTLVVAGEHDYTSIEDKRHYVSELPHARLEVIGGSRHATHVDKSKQFNRLVLGFLFEHPMTERRRPVRDWLRRLRARLLSDRDKDSHEPPRASA